MNAQHLHHFLTTLRLSSMLRAAETLGISQPALSKSIKRLEDEVGAPLFQRSARGVIPTEVALVIKPHLEAALAELAMAQKKARLVNGGGAGAVTVAAAPNVVRVLLIPAIKAFAQRNDQVMVKVLELGSKNVIDAVVRGDADLGIVGNAANMHPDEFVFEKLMDDELILYSRDSRVGATTTFPAADLGRLNLVSFERTDAFQQYLTERLQQAGLRLPPSQVTVSSLAALTDYLSLTGVSAILLRSSATLVRQAAGADTFVRRIEGISLPWPVEIIRRRSAAQSVASARLIAELRSVGRSLSAQAKEISSSRSPSLAKDTPPTMETYTGEIKGT
jgi:DNA-binding transcriptional LysR family regulator